MFPRLLFRSLPPLALGCLLLAGRTHAEPFSGALADGTALFLPDGLPPDQLPPSLALLEPPKTHGPPGR